MRNAHIRHVLSAAMALALLAAGGGRAHAGMSRLSAGKGPLVRPGRCPRSSPSAINRRGDIVGSCIISDNISYGELLRGGRSTFIAVPHSKSTDPYSINSEGDIVGRYTDQKGNDHNFLLHAGRYITLDDPSASKQPEVGTSAFGINDHGDVVGYYDVPDKTDKKHDLYLE